MENPASICRLFLADPLGLYGSRTGGFFEASFSVKIDTNLQMFCPNDHVTFMDRKFPVGLFSLSSRESFAPIKKAKVAL